MHALLPLLAADGDDAARSMLLTVAVAIAAGAMLVVLARRSGLPAIVLLLAGGVLLGPAVFGVIDPDRLGDGLPVIVSLAIGLILFEGGLTLDIRGYRTAPAMIKRLLSVGVAITWMGTAIAIWLVVGRPLHEAVVAGSLVIVTGPTVIAPLLKRLRLDTRLHSILHWEAVLIDPLGVFIALLCFETIAGGGADAAVNFGVRIAWGLAVGVLGGTILARAVRREMVPEDAVNVFALGTAVLVFAVAEAVVSEAGLLATAVAGFVFGVFGPTELRQVRRFKSEMTDLLIGMLFILLAARLSFDQFRAFGVAGFVVVAIVILVIRPLSVLACSTGLDLSMREKAFLGWIAPRGIVAASMASLFALAFEELGSIEDPKFVETFTYSVIVATIVLQGLTAGPLVRLLDLRRAEPTGWLIVGAHGFGRAVAAFLRGHVAGPVVLLDSNNRSVREASEAGFDALVADARDVTLADRPLLQGVGQMLVLTDNEDLNIRLCEIWSDVFSADRIHRASPAGGESGGGRNGVAVWSRLPRASVLSAEIGRGEAMLLEIERPDPVPPDALPLIAVEKTRVTLDPPADDLPETGSVLALRREAAYLLRGLQPELILTLEVPDVPSLFDRLVDRAVHHHPRIGREEAMHELLDRERSFPTALGHGVAVPHAYCAGLDHQVIILARLPRGVDWGARDGKPVRLAFLLLSPHGDPEGHLAALAEIARLVSREDMRLRLLAAADPWEVYRLVRHAAGL